MLRWGAIIGNTTLVYQGAWPVIGAWLLLIATGRPVVVLVAAALLGAVKGLGAAWLPAPTMLASLPYRRPVGSALILLSSAVLSSSSLFVDP